MIFIITGFGDGGVVVFLFAGSAARDTGKEPKDSRGNATLSSDTKAASAEVPITELGLEDKKDEALKQASENAQASN
jgi:hypothetical protein